MVYTVTLNPCVDYVMRLPALRRGEVNRAQQTQLRPGGKGLNVSLLLTRLGVANTATGFAAGAVGEQLLQMLDQMGVQLDFIQLPRGDTRINVKLHADDTTEINAPGPAIDPQTLAQLSHRLGALQEGDVLVLAGSVPAGVPQQIYARLLAQAPRARAVVDTTGEALRAALPCRPFLIKPNHHELGALFGQSLQTQQHILSCARLAQERGARNVLVSMAGDGAVLLDETGTAHIAAAPQGDVRDAVGAGDSMVAGFLAGWQRWGDYAQALRLGVAAGSATAFSDWLAEKEAVDRLLPRVEVRSIRS